MIGDDIVVTVLVVTVLAINGKQVRLGIKAPESLSVDRSEIRAKKDAGPVSGNT
jgi:carbon storage regulator CsrA